MKIIFRMSTLIFNVTKRCNLYLQPSITYAELSSVNKETDLYQHANIGKKLASLVLSQIHSMRKAMQYTHSYLYTHLPESDRNHWTRAGLFNQTIAAGNN